MLPRANRLTSSIEISAVIKNGRRTRLPHATVYMWIKPASSPPQAAVAVGKPVGNSVVRGAVARRIRHGLAPLVPLLPTGSLVVVRAFTTAVAPSATEWTENLRIALAAWLKDGPAESVGQAAGQ